MARPTFLDLPARQSKPRTAGLTHVLDKGLGVPATRDLVDQCGHLIDVVKVGWGIGYVDPRLEERIAVYRDAGIVVCLGGTLLEVTAAQNRVDGLRAWALGVGVTAVEVSNGLGALDVAAKSALVRCLSADFLVAAEVGSKDAETPVVAAEWVDEMTADLDAGATWVIAEGRETGTVGLYQHNGEVRDGLVSELLDHVPVERIIFEAPNKAQQSWFIKTAGHNVNLGNVAPDDVLPLETLRLGLRADTAQVRPLAQMPLTR